jgi:triphosphatase
MVEEELKYSAVDLDAVAAWLDQRYPPAMDEAWRRVSVTDRYFDTPDFALARAGYGARLRRQAGRTTLTLKSDIEVSGARHRREEIDAPAGASLEPESWPPSSARELLVELAGRGPFVDRFAIRQRRRERGLSYAGAELAASLDDARVVLDGVELARLRGLEVELVSGRRGALSGLADELATSGVVQPQPISKLQLGHALVAAVAPLEPSDPFAEAGRKVLARHLARLLDRQPQAQTGEQLALKQMRVATRRMRSAWRVFDGAYRRTAQRRHLRALRAVARRLGAVRDLDVLLAGLAQGAGLEPLIAAWTAEREQAMGELARHLDSARYAAFVTASRRFAGTPWLDASRRLGDARVSDLAGARLREAHAQMLERGVRIESADDTALHALRIAAKRLRYAIETFRGLTAAGPTERCLARLVALQDALGAANDAAVAGSRARDWLAGVGASAPRPAQAAVRRQLQRWQAEQLAARASALDVWPQLASAEMERDVGLLAGHS